MTRLRRWGWRGALAALALALGVGMEAGPAAAQDVGGGVYLFRYQPVDFDGADGRSEVYAAFLQVAHSTGPWELYLEARAETSTTSTD